MAQILIIDDSMFAREFMKRALEQKGFEVTTQNTGREGIRFARAQQPDLIMLDLTMKGESGYTICAKLKADPLCKNIPVIFITSITEKENIVRAFETGAADYIGKPFSEVELIARINAHLNYKFAQDELKRINRRLEVALAENEALAYQDHLTGLYNRHYLWEKFEHLYASGAEKKQAAILMLDIDHFKRINDTYGHSYGDVVLEKVATLFRLAVADAGHAGRWGGEEFLAIIEDRDPDGAWDIAEHIRSSIQAHWFSFDGKRVECTVTVGVAPIDFSKNVDDSINLADEALYEGKIAGRNRCVLKLWDEDGKA